MNNKLQISISALLIATLGLAPSLGWCRPTAVSITASNQGDFVSIAKDSKGGEVFCQVSKGLTGEVTSNKSSRRFTPYSLTIEKLNQEVRRLQQKRAKASEIAKVKAKIATLRQMEKRYQAACKKASDKPGNATPTPTASPTPSSSPTPSPTAASTPTPAPTTKPSECELTRCSKDSVSYSCSTSSQTVHYEYCGGSNIVKRYTFDFTNGHKLICNASCTFGDFTDCADDTGASCRIP